MTMVPWLLLVLPASCRAHEATPAAENFQRICPELNSTQQPSTSEYTMTYHCYTYPRGFDTDSIAIVDDPADCSSVCLKDVTCHGAVWSSQSRECWLTHVHDDTPIRMPASEHGLLYMHKTINETPQAPGGSEELAKCQKDLTDTQIGLGQCRNSNTQAASSYQTLQKNFATQSATLQDELAARCPGSHAGRKHVSGRIYQFWCARYHDSTGPRETSTVAGFADCVKRCTARNWCTYALHGIYHHRCQLYDRRVGTSTIPGLSSHEYNSAIKL